MLLDTDQRSSDTGTPSNIKGLVFSGHSPCKCVSQGPRTLLHPKGVKEFVILPFLCLTTLGLGGVLAYILSRVFSINSKQIGAYIGCSTFTNIGALGALFCYMFIGEAGFAFVPTWKIQYKF